MLKHRVLSALVLLPLLLALIFMASHLWFVVVIAALVVLGAWEWAQFMGLSGGPRLAAGAVGGATVIGTGWGLVQLDWVGGAMETAVIAWAASPMLMATYPRILPRVLRAAIGLLVLTTTWLALVGIHAAGERGPELLLFLLLMVWAADVGAYVAGHAFGRHKLAPQVSPGKTVEGALGGGLTTAAVGAAGIVWFGMPALAGALTVAAVFFASVLGDLLESYLKRLSGIKDSGTLLPGHGGVLDRIDSLTAAAPVFLLALVLLGWS